MKRAGLFVAVLLIFSLIPLIYAEGEAPGAPGITEMPFANETQKVQQQYEQYTTAENKSAYLTQEWGKLIGRAKIIGPIHNFLSSNQIIFKIFFNYPYELSLTFFFVLFIWLTFLFKSAKLIKSFGFIKEVFSLPVALLFAIIFAQISVFNFIAKGISNILFSTNAWWARIIIFILACTIIITLSILSDYLSRYFKRQEEKKKIAELEQTAREFKAEQKGIKEGQAIAG